MARVEWDTLLFFYGVIMCVGGLSFVGYLAHMSAYFYGDLGATTANVLVGVMSAIVDNIPIMVAVLEMEPSMDITQWLLVTLTAGVGGSLLSIGSAAGVALMGQARGQYTFFRHLRWTPAIALGYGASIWVHLAINSGLNSPAMPWGASPSNCLPPGDTASRRIRARASPSRANRLSPGPKENLPALFW